MTESEKARRRAERNRRAAALRVAQRERQHARRSAKLANELDRWRTWVALHPETWPEDAPSRRS